MGASVSRGSSESATTSRPRSQLAQTRLWTCSKHKRRSRRVVGPTTTTSEAAHFRLCFPSRGQGGTTYMRVWVAGGGDAHVRGRHASSQGRTGTTSAGGGHMLIWAMRDSLRDGTF